MSRRRSAFVRFGSLVLTRSSSWSATAARLAASGVVGASGASWAADSPLYGRQTPHRDRSRKPQPCYPIWQGS